MKILFYLLIPIFLFSCTEVDENDYLPEWDEVVRDLEIPEKSELIDTTNANISEFPISIDSVN